MRVTGDAEAVVDRLSNEDQLNIDKVCGALVRAFGADSYSSYDKLVLRNLAEGESVDVFLADIEKLAFGCGISGELPLKCAFVRGLPESVRHVLRANSKLDDLSLEQILDRARVILTDNHRSTHTGSVMCAVSSSPSPLHHQLRCFNCDEIGHLARQCVKVKQPIMFYNCGERGHIAAKCHKAENEHGEGTSAPVSSRQ